jgi:hypothetical protein
VIPALPAEKLAQAYTQVAALEAALRVAPLTRRPHDHRHAPEPDRAVRLEEAVTLLGMTETEDCLYRHWRKLGGHKQLLQAMRALGRHAIAHSHEHWRSEGWRVLPEPCGACRALAAALGPDPTDEQHP